MAVSGSTFWKLIVVVFVVVGLILGFFGLIFILAAPVQQTQERLLIGGGLSAVALIVILVAIWTARTKVQVNYTVKAQLDLPADFSLRGLQCRNCGAPLSRDMVTWNQKTGSIMVNCTFCNTQYEFVQEARW